MITVKMFFDQDTATCSYVVFDNETRCAALIDTVLNFDIATGATSTVSADTLITYVKEQNLSIDWILETHIHADHLTAARYLKAIIGGKICIGSGIKDVLAHWVPFYGLEDRVSLSPDGFDQILNDGDILSLGKSSIKILATPGHTPACISYKIEEHIFVGDTLFMPDVGTARTDFPGGSSEQLYQSVQKFYTLSDDIIIHVGHDYPIGGRAVQSDDLLESHKNHNVLLSAKVNQDNFIANRNARDVGKPVPRLLLPAIQFNMTGGGFYVNPSNKREYILIPVNAL